MNIVDQAAEAWNEHVTKNREAIYSILSWCPKSEHDILSYSLRLSWMMEWIRKNTPDAVNLNVALALMLVEAEAKDFIKQFTRYMDEDDRDLPDCSGLEQALANLAKQRNETTRI